MEVKWSLVQISVVVAIIQTSLSFFIRLKMDLSYLIE
jgi:hypothetical protein